MPVNLEDFDSAEIEIIASQAERQNNFAIAEALLRRAHHLRNEGRAEASSAMTLLADVCSMALKPENSSEPFGPQIIHRERGRIVGRSFALEDLDAPQVEVLCNFLMTVSCRDIRARLADVGWVRKRSYPLLRIAVAEYLRDLPVIPDAYCLYDLARVRRALALLRIANQRDELGWVVSLLGSYLIDLIPRDHSFFGLELMRSLGGYLEERIEPVYLGLIDVATEAARSAAQFGNWDRARLFWEEVGRLRKLQGDTGGAVEAERRAAETYVSLADSCVGQHMENSIASSFVWDAIKAFRSISGSEERIAVLHRRLLDHQAKSVKELGRVDTSMDVSAVVDEVHRRVSGRSIEAALAELAGLVEVSSKEMLRRSVAGSAEEGGFLSQLGGVQVAGDGRVVASRDGLELSDVERDEGALLQRMCELAATRQECCGGLRIDLARRMILMEHKIEFSFFDALVRRSVLGMDGRSGIIARGLWAGMYGDFLAATHFLVPQIEEWVRFLLRKNNVITSGLDASGIQRQHDLGRTLYGDDIVGILGADDVFNMQVLMVESLGANLRNLVAHGLLELKEFDSAQTRYFWGLVLRWVVLGSFEASGRVRFELGSSAAVRSSAG